MYNLEVTEQTRPNFRGLFRSKEGLWLVNIEKRCLNNADFLNFCTSINVFRIHEIFSYMLKNKNEGFNINMLTFLEN